MSKTNTPVFWTPQELAEALKISPQAVRRFIRIKKIPALQVGQMWRITNEVAMKIFSEGIPQSDEP